MLPVIAVQFNSQVHLSGCSEGVPDGERKGYGATKSCQEKHVLKVVADLVLPAKVQEERQRVDVQRPPNDD